MRSLEEFERVLSLVDQGLNNSAIERATGIPRGTVRDWRRKSENGWSPGQGGRSWEGSGLASRGLCPVCSKAALDHEAYAYLLGMYLGDGCLSAGRRDVYRLRIVLDQSYLGIIAECVRCVETVHGRKSVGVVEKEGCVEVYSYWKHWPCLFPQHGPGRKHERPIVLTGWQRDIVRAQPARFLRGLLHSDGWRGVNRVNGTDYPRYQFTNESEDIRTLFTWACDLYGVRWRRMKRNTISVARADDVLKLDFVVGPKG